METYDEFLLKKVLVLLFLEDLKKTKIRVWEVKRKKKKTKKMK